MQIDLDFAKLKHKNDCELKLTDLLTEDGRPHTNVLLKPVITIKPQLHAFKRFTFFLLHSPLHLPLTSQTYSIVLSISNYTKTKQNILSLLSRIDKEYTLVLVLGTVMVLSSLIWEQLSRKATSS